MDRERKISFGYRLAAAIIVLLMIASICLTGALILIGEIRLQEFMNLGLGLVFLPLVLVGGLYVFIPVALLGYPPKALLWTADRRTAGDRSVKQLFWAEMLANENAHHPKSSDQQK